MMDLFKMGVCLEVYAVASLVNAEEYQRYHRYPW